MAEKLPSAKRVTMREIARLAGGVHPSTVSLALQNAPSISAAMRSRIQALAAKAGYRRDPWLDAFNARRLTRRAHRVQPVIAWVSAAESRAAMLASPREAARWRGASEAAQALHFGIEAFFAGENGVTAKRLESIFHARGIESFVLTGAEALTGAEIAWERYSAVSIDGDEATPGYVVTADLRQGARRAVQQAQASGARRAGLILRRDRGASWNEQLVSGYLLEQDARALEKDITPLVSDEIPTPGELAEWLTKHAVDFVLSDWPGTGALLARAKSGRRRKLPWCSLDVTEAPNGVAGVVLPHERIGRLAIEQVVSLARTNQRGGSAGVSTTFVPVGWRGA